MNIVYIYGLVDPRDGLIYYIGKTSMGLKARFSAHIYKSKKCRTPKERWINSLIVEGYQPLMNELARLEKPTDAEVAVTEQAWIDFYQLSNPKLTNVGIGGQGGSGSHRLCWTPELEAQLGKVSDGEIAEQLGCDRRSVAYRRHKLGIFALPRLPRRISKFNVQSRLKWTPELEAQLGKVSDGEIAEQLGCSPRSVSYRRHKLGIFAFPRNSCAGIPKSNVQSRLKWTPELVAQLGKVPDWKIAEQLGCDRKSVAYRREKLGIPRCPQTNFVIPPMGGWNRIELPEDVVSQLGKVSDCKLAEQLGVDKSVVRRCRIEKGIASYSESVNHPTRFKTGQPHPRWN